MQVSAFEGPSEHVVGSNWHLNDKENHGVDFTSEVHIPPSFLTGCFGSLSLPVPACLALSAFPTTTLMFTDNFAPQLEHNNLIS